MLAFRWHTRLHRLQAAKRPCNSPRPPAAGPGASASAGAAVKEGADGITIRVTPVNLEGPPFHAENWRHTIVPRCIEVCNALQAVRADDGKR